MMLCPRIDPKQPWFAVFSSLVINSQLRFQHCDSPTFICQKTFYQPYKITFWSFNSKVVTSISIQLHGINTIAFWCLHPILGDQKGKSEAYVDWWTWPAWLAWHQMGQKGQYLAQNDQKCIFQAKFGRCSTKNPNSNGKKQQFCYTLTHYLGT